MLPVLLLASPVTEALTVVEGKRAIDATTPVDSYQLNPGAWLEAVDASTLQLDIGSGAQLQMQRSNVDAQGADGIALRGGARVTIADNSRVVSDRYGL
ncbi:hypothetical protein NL323_28660, partial [Klebsiella pneumoniae]|nr:hypothetical protein [Klebsiella pneumoniae]